MQHISMLLKKTALQKYDIIVKGLYNNGSFVPICATCGQPLLYL
jgi:hypothetical protein